MIDALGFIEISGTVAAVDALDIMCKAADVHLVTWERKLGGRLVTLVVTGTVSAVSAAVESAREKAIKNPVAYNVIPRPHSELIRMLRQSINFQHDLEEAPAKAEAPKAPAKPRARKSTAAAKTPKTEAKTEVNTEE